jgi:hypothetical protein
MDKPKSEIREWLESSGEKKMKRGIKPDPVHKRLANFFKSLFAKSKDSKDRR